MITKLKLFEWTRGGMVAVANTLYCSTKPLFISFTVIQKLQKEYFEAGYNSGVELKRTDEHLDKQCIIDTHQAVCKIGEATIRHLKKDVTDLEGEVFRIRSVVEEHHEARDRYQDQIRQLTNEVCDLRASICNNRKVKNG